MPRLNEEHVSVNVLDVGEWPTVPHGCKKGLCVLVEAAMLEAELDVGFKRRPPGREFKRRHWSHGLQKGYRQALLAKHKFGSRQSLEPWLSSLGVVLVPR